MRAGCGQEWVLVNSTILVASGTMISPSNLPLLKKDSYTWLFKSRIRRIRKAGEKRVSNYGPDEDEDGGYLRI